MKSKIIIILILIGVLEIFLGLGISYYYQDINENLYMLKRLNQPIIINHNIKLYETKELFCFKPYNLLIANTPQNDVKHLCLFAEGVTIRE